MCEPPFKSAGGHFNPGGAKHGIDSAEGMNVGDMPNIHVPDSGALEIEVLNTQLHHPIALPKRRGELAHRPDSPSSLLSACLWRMRRFR